MSTQTYSFIQHTYSPKAVSLAVTPSNPSQRLSWLLRLLASRRAGREEADETDMDASREHVVVLASESSPLSVGKGGGGLGGCLVFIDRSDCPAPPSPSAQLSKPCRAC